MFSKLKQLGAVCAFLIACLWARSGWVMPADFPEFDDALAFPIESYTTQQTLVHPQNFALGMRPDGVLVVGEGNGLVTFDGQRWTRIDTPQMGRVRAFSIADDGRIYAGTVGDIGYFEAAQSAAVHFVSLREGYGTLPEFTDIWSVEQLGGRVFYLAHEALLAFDGTRVDHWLPQRQFGKMWKLGSTLVVSDEGVGLLQLRQGKLLPLPGSEALRKRHVSFVRAFPDDPRRWLVGVADGAMLVYQDGTLSAWDTPIARDLAGLWPYQARWLQGDILAVTTIRGGVLLADPEGRVISHIDTNSGLKFSTALDILDDGHGGVWIAQDGAVSHMPFPPAVTRLDVSPFGVSVVYALARLGDTLLAGTNTGLFTVATGVIGAQPGLQHTLPEIGQVWNMSEWRNGLMVSASGGVYEVQQRTGSGIDATRVMATDYAYDTAFDTSNSTLYVATQHGVSWLRPSNGQWSRAVPIPAIMQPVKNLAISPDGSLWAGTGEQTVYHIIGSPGAWTVHRFAGESGIPPGNAYVYRFQGKLFIGADSGLYQAYDGDHGLELDITDDLPDVFHTPGNDIFRLAEDARGNVAARNGNHTGIAFRQADGSYRWDEETLRPFGEGVAFSLLYEADGVVWIGRSGDLLRWDTRVKGQELTVPKLYFGSMRLGHAPLKGNWYGAANPDLAFTMGDRTLHIEYAMPAFTAPAATRYSTRLAGFTERYSDWSATGYKEFTNLPPGRYQLDVRARDIFGRISQSMGSEFRVEPPWYLAPTAKAAYGLAALLFFALSTWATTRWRSARLARDNLHLQTQVELHTRKLTRQAEQLRRLDRAKSDFFTNVSHEFRTPLTLTIGPLDDVLNGRHGRVGQAMHKALDMARRNAHQVLDLIGQLLEVNRLEAGEGRLSITKTDLCALARDMAGRFAGLAERRQIHFSTDFPDQAVPMWLDERAICRVLENLLSNAFKYTKPEGAINFTLKNDPRTARLMVIDTGRGIPKAALPRVFDRFYRANNEALAADIGTGVGLSLCKELVELHGGHIEAQSEEGRGSCFVFALRHGREHLPEEWFTDPAMSTTAAARVSPAASTMPATPATDTDSDTADRTTVLVVDDNAEIRSFIREHLQTDFKVIEAHDGRQGVTRASEALPDLIISDIMMPVLDGYGLCRAIRDNPATDCIPIILLTAKATTRDTIDGIEGGADEYLTKPFYAAELLARVKALIQTRRRLRERFAQQPPEAAATPGQSAFADQLYQVIGEHLSDSRFNVEILATAMAMERTTLYRRVKDEFHAAPVAIIRRYRMQQALRLLRDNAGSVSEVAYGVGFDSLSYFTRVFCKEYGFPPSEARPAEQTEKATS